ncbi:MAG: hypothetical protein ACT4OS_10610 [Acidimicrobiales bacterium]
MGSDRGQAGAGAISTALGTVVLVAFLGLATQTMLGLYARSVVGAVVDDAARRVARVGPDPVSRAQAVADAETAARSALGEAGHESSFAWSLEHPDVVTVETLTPGPRVLGLFSGDGLIRHTSRASQERWVETP